MSPYNTPGVTITVPIPTEYTQLKVALRELLLELGITLTNLKSISIGISFSEDVVKGKITLRTAQKLLAAGIL